MANDSEYNDPFRGEWNSDIHDYKNPKKIITNPNAGIQITQDETYYKELFSLYSNILDANGSNLKDPFAAYMTHFNKLQKRWIDPPTAGKTYIFITRPDLNFWERNSGIRNVERVSLFNYFSKMEIGKKVMPWLMFPNNMVTEFRRGGKETGEFIRTTRIRVGNTDIYAGGDSERGGVRFNAFTPFIPLLSNLCVNCSGAKDISIDTKITDGDYHGNKLQWAKGADDSFEPGEITLDFEDAFGSPILHLINIWVNYIHYLTKGVTVEWGQYIKYRILDYTCSIYVFMCEKDNTTITRWAKWTGCFPKSIPLSNIQHNLELNADALKSVSVPFAYNRYEAMKPDIFLDFNHIMNKFLFDTDKQNKTWLNEYGVAPQQLIDPSVNPTELIDYHPEWNGPKHKDEEGNIVSDSTLYHQNKFWGSCPYILNHQLKWINPNGIDFSNMAAKYRQKEDNRKTAANQLVNAASSATSVYSWEANER